MKNSCSLLQRHLYIKTKCFYRFKCPRWTNYFSLSTKEWRDTYCFSRTFSSSNSICTQKTLFRGCNSFTLWYRLMIFGMWVYYHKMLYHGSSRPSHDLDLRSQGQIIEFREFSYPGCNFLSFDIDLWYLVCRCIIIRWYVMYHHDLHMTLTLDIKVK